MTSLFNYNSFKISLNRKTRNTHLSFLTPYFSLESLFEMETFFGWLTNKVEINSVTITSESDYFPGQLNPSESIHFSSEKIQEVFQRFQKLILGMKFLPQTIIFDLKKGTEGLGAELSLGGDIRVAQKRTKIQFNSLEKGLLPSSGGIGLLSLLMGQAIAANWNLSPSPITEQQLIGSGFLKDIYQESFSRAEYCHQISRQSPICRIQAKRALLNPILSQVEQILKDESQILFAGISVEDWKRYILAENAEEILYMSPLEFAKECSKQRSYQSPAT